MNQDFLDCDLPEPQPQPQSPQKNSKQKRLRRAERFLNILIVVAIVLCIAVIALRLFVFTRVEVRQTSMSTTYLQGETVWLSKITPISRGCVAVFYEDEHEYSLWDSFLDQEYKLLIKRIVAIEGDKIWVEQLDSGNYILVILPAQAEQAIFEDYYIRGENSIEIPDMHDDKLGRLANHIGADNAYEIPQGCFFALGDNRNLSIDSREPNGDIPTTRLLGVVLQ